MRSCLVYLAIFLALGIAGAFALANQAPPPPHGYPALPLPQALLLAARGSFPIAAFVVLALFGLRDTAQRLRDRARLAEGSIAPPADGARTIVAGELVADGPLLHSPFTGTPCACYAYEVRCTTKGRGKNPPTDVLVAWGCALTPSHIASPAGAVRLLSCPNIEESPPAMEDQTVRRTAAAYFARTTLIPTGMGAAGLGYGEVLKLHADSDGQIKGDFGPLPDDFAGGEYRLYEKILADREPVAATGTWSSRLGGLTHQPGHEILGAIVVRKGPPEKAQRTLLKQAIGGAIAALVLLGIGAGIWWLILRNGQKFFY